MRGYANVWMFFDLELCGLNELKMEVGAVESKVLRNREEIQKGL